MTQTTEVAPQDPTSQDRFTLAVWRRLRDTATPIPEAEVATIAADAGLDPDALAHRLRGGAERDDAGRLLGLGGLTVAEHPHALWFGDRRLATWCAWDPFFLAPALGGSARLETTDPVTGAPFAVTFVDGEAQPLEGAQPVLSMVDRTALRGLDGTGEEGPAVGESIEEVWSSFWSHVHLFGSEQTAHQFFSDRDTAFELLTMDQASAHAAQTHRRLLEAARLID